MNLTEVLNRLTFQRALIMGVVIAAFYYFAVYDNGSEKLMAIEASKQRIIELEGQIKDSQAKIDRAAVYKKAAQQDSATLAKHLSRIPEKFSDNDLQRIVSNEHKVAGLSLVTLARPEEARSEVAQNFQEVSVGVELTGSFTQQMVFLSNLTKVNQILVVRDFEIRQAESPSPEGQLVHMKATVVAYRYLGDTSANPPAEGQDQQQPVTQ